MSDKKLSKGTYYSCSHQKLNNSSCNTCKQEREGDENQPLDKDPLFTNTTFLPCQGNCGKNPLVEIHS